MNIFDYLNLNRRAFEETNENFRRVEAEKLFGFFSGDRYIIKKCLVERMQENLKVENPYEWELFYINIIPKILNNLSSFYRPSETITYKIFNEDGSINLKSTENYNKICKQFNLNFYKKTAFKAALLFNTVLVGLKYNKQLNSLQPEIIFPHQCSILQAQNNYLKIKALSIDYEDSDGAIIHHVWTPEKFFITDYKYDIISEEENELGIIPYIAFRISDKGDFWGENLSFLMDINNEINVQLTSLSTHGIYQGGSVLFGVNVTENGQLKIGPNSSVQVIESPNNKFTPSLQYITPDPKIEEIISLIEFYIKQAYILCGLSSFSFESTPTVQSGISKAFNRIELIEQRKDYLEAISVFEQKFFDLLKLILIFNGNNTISGEFLEIKMEENSDDLIVDDFERDLKNLEFGIVSLYDLLRKRLNNSFLSDDECDKILRKNFEILKSLGINREEILKK